MRRAENMSVLLVSYDLDGPSRNYEDLYEEIKSYGGWAKPLESVWFIDTSQSVSSVRDNLRSKLDSGDKLFVVKMRKNWATSFSNDATDWLKDSGRTWD